MFIIFVFLSVGLASSVGYRAERAYRLADGAASREGIDLHTFAVADERGTSELAYASAAARAFSVFTLQRFSGRKSAMQGERKIIASDALAVGGAAHRLDRRRLIERIDRCHRARRARAVRPQCR